MIGDDTYALLASPGLAFNLANAVASAEMYAAWREGGDNPVTQAFLEKVVRVRAKPMDATARGQKSRK
ncbi:hypothetical protein [Robbsia sp. KACC 23696]|uniref:hypothetical protein n=1 Tax=Robbsia sp. KACC 23696 TaxID=3149231 RepID=UPI00325B7A99